MLSLAVTPTTAGFIVVARDVGQEREIQDERRELDRQMFQMEKLTTLGELAMGVAHEIGNPLAGMKAVAQAMQYEDDIDRSAGGLETHGGRDRQELSGFLRSFHGFAAPQAISREPCRLDQILDDVLFWTRKDAKSANIGFELSDIEPQPALSADSQQLKQVLLNLLMNAIHAMPEGGIVTVNAKNEANFKIIRVTDSGVGMSDDVLKRIFEPFYTTRRKVPASGWLSSERLLSSMVAVSP